MPRKLKQKADHRADTRGAPWAGLPHVVLNSEAYRQLDVMARAVLVEIVREMNGYNNGRIVISYARLAQRLNRKNQAKFGPAIAQLIEHGLLDIEAGARWKERLAREYRLTFVNTTDRAGRPLPATNEYLKWEPGKNSGTTDAVAGRRRSATTFVAGRPSVATTVVAAAEGEPRPKEGAAATTEVALISKPYEGAQTTEGKSGDLGPIPPAGPAEACLVRDEARLLVKAHTRAVMPALSSAAGIQVDRLAGFIDDGLDLPSPSLARLNRAIGRLREAA